MSKIHAEHVFTSESVSEGHPDKVCDQISDAILDACLKDDPNSRVACETLATTDLIVISGEITTKSQVNWEKVARQVVSEIGYTDGTIGFSAENCKVMVCIHKQSPDISQGVTAGQGIFKEQGAGAKWRAAIRVVRTRFNSSGQGDCRFPVRKPAST